MSTATTDQPLASRAFAALPELLGLVAHNLAPQDLFQCIQACRFWTQVFIPRLWCTVDDEALSWPRFLRHHHHHRDNSNIYENGNDKSEGFVQHIFHKYGRFIQHLDLHYWITIKAAVSSSISSTSNGCSHLCYLRVTHSIANNRMTMTGRDHTPVTTLGSEKQNALIQAVWELAQQNSSTLTTFRIDKSFARPSLHTINPAAPPTEAMYNTIRNLSNLLELEIIDDKADFDRVLRMASPQLKYLCAPGWIQLRGTDGQLLHETFTSVRTVELFQETDLRAVFSLLRYLPNLESLLLTGGFNQELFQNDQLEAMEARTRMDNTPNRSLRQLTLYGIQFMDTRIMTTVFPWIPELREFSCDELCLDMSEALVRHCQHLEVVCELDTFGGDYETRSERRGFDIVMPLLKGCPSLRVLDTVAQRIQGDSFIGYEIVCLERLETFRCQIGGMCRLDEAISRVLNLTLTGDSDGDTEEQGGGGQGIGSVASRADKERGLFDEIRRNEERYRKVYKQLSKMTKLRVLELGQEYRAEPDTFGSSQSALNGMSSDFDEDEDDDYVDYNWYRPPIEDTLDLTLASGLNQLETLKNLEVFGFEGVDHRMEKVEMDWMAAKWPKLKVMRGIHVDILPNVEPDTKRTELREYMQMLRPEVVHETLYKRRRVFSR